MPFSAIHGHKTTTTNRLAGQISEDTSALSAGDLLERPDGGGFGIAFDAGNLGLRHPKPGGQLLLRQAGSFARRGDSLPGQLTAGRRQRQPWHLRTWS